LSRAFAHRFLTRLEVAYRQQRLVFPASLTSIEAPTAFQAWVDTLRRHAWVVYAKPPFGGPATMLDRHGVRNSGYERNRAATQSKIATLAAKVQMNPRQG
jgi:hypothetical protein